ncbi:MAG: hypothetical protein ACKVU2_10565, partial [Saprospiraceae bacterium]
MRIYVLLLPALLLGPLATAQEGKAILKNASFEDVPQASHVPEGWFYYGPVEETPPDVQPGYYGCTTKPLRGNTYLGMVTRDNGTTECVGQQLDKPLLADSAYDFSVCLATSSHYESLSRSTGEEVNYTSPVCLRIWGISLEQEKRVLLAESPLVTNTDWIRYRFELRPPGMHLDLILLEAWYGIPQKHTNGNLLVDHCSPLVPKFVPDSARLAEAIFRPPPPKAKRIIELYNPSFELAPVYFLPFGWEDTAGEITTWARTHPLRQQEVKTISKTYVQFYVGRYGEY